MKEFRWSLQHSARPQVLQDRRSVGKHLDLPSSQFTSDIDGDDIAFLPCMRLGAQIEKTLSLKSTIQGILDAPELDLFRDIQGLRSMSCLPSNLDARMEHRAWHVGQVAQIGLFLGLAPTSRQDEKGDEYLVRT